MLASTVLLLLGSATLWATQADALRQGSFFPALRRSPTVRLFSFVGPPPPGMEAMRADDTPTLEALSVRGPSIAGSIGLASPERAHVVLCSREARPCNVRSTWWGVANLKS